ITQIGEGVELVNGIIGYGCHIFYGVKAVRFITGTKANIKYGARVINSYLGDNSTVSCCEVLHNLIFPNHEQHHNNSFLIASCVQGQSNMAANATVGSNHNSRANDGEILAKRGFWPGLCSNFKHNCRFASFTLVAKGNYPAELDVKVPFSLISNNEQENMLQVMPAYWFLYNMYAIVRNSWKWNARDKRVHDWQKIEFDFLAPDTVEEMLEAVALLEIWTAKAWHRSQGEDSSQMEEKALREKGFDLLYNRPKEAEKLEILADAFEHSRRKVQILKAAKAYRMYRTMIHYYAVKNLAAFIDRRNVKHLRDLREALPLPAETLWHNVGGQIMRDRDLRDLMDRVRTGDLNDWEKIHAEYARHWERYPDDKAAHALHALLALHDRTFESIIDENLWSDYLDRGLEVQRDIARLTRDSRQKDYENPFKKMSYDSEEEQNAVMGDLDENPLLQMIEDETREFERLIHAVKASEA
ncbi:DUF4954 family protein, partial [bacterium]|nr:DUF4954 family protein [bacterium]